MVSYEPLSLTQQKICAAFTSFIMILKLIDWLRLFEQTAFFVNLMAVTIMDIRWFMIVMVIWYMTFGASFYILGLTRTGETSVDEYNHE